jgi:RNA polymerase sigma factor (TIGR02999 family)
MTTAHAIDRVPIETASRALSRRADLDALSNAYQRLLEIAHRRLVRERRAASYDTGELVQETYERLMQQRVSMVGDVRIEAAARIMMDRILIDRARRKRRLKRGANGTLHAGDLSEESFATPATSYEAVAVATAMMKLRDLDERQARVVEMRVLAGMQATEIAVVLGVTRRTVDRDWVHARCWLRRELGRFDPE